VTVSKDIDWTTIERDYRTGLLSLREIAEPHGISETAVRKRAKRDNWDRDLEARIQARADALVRKAEVRDQVRNANLASDREIIEANAERIAAVRSEHRKDIQNLRGIAERLISELHQAEQDGTLYEQVRTLKALTETVESIVKMEREAYGIDKSTPEKPANDDTPPIDMMDAVRRFAFILSGYDQTTH